MVSYLVWWGLKGSSYSLFGVHFGLQMFAIMALPIIYIHTKSKIRVNKWLFYLFYPAHMIAIMALDRFVL